MKRINVVAGAERYDVLVGPFELARDRLPPSFILVSEPKVFALHGKRVRELLGGEPPILLPEGEAAKQWDVLHALLAQLDERRASRSTAIVALGGGSVGDVAGLAASLFKRGCPVIHLPTTLLAQADSAVGGKTAIDALGQKNLVGTFHMPTLVVADPSLLDTLDLRQLRSGYAEVVKYGLIDDPSFFAWCEQHGAALIAGDRDARTHAVLTSIKAKARIVAADPLDLNGRRALLNLGHSFAHAIEATAGLGRLLHGEAVAIGMVLAFRLSVGLGHCSDTDQLRLSNHLTSVGLPTCLAEVGLAGSGEALLAHLVADKKATAAGVSLILMRGIGAAFVQQGVSPAALETFVRSL